MQLNCDIFRQWSVLLRFLFPVWLYKFFSLSLFNVGDADPTSPVMDDNVIHEV
jgi:hypothetical protein